MATVTENDLKELKDLIITQNQKIDKLVEKLSSDMTDIKVGISELKGELKGDIKAINTRLDTYKPAIDKIPDLAEKVGELKGWRAIALVIFSGFVTSLYWLFRTGKL